jgi:hypothetical protein
MKSLSNRNTENLLFATLILVVIGCSAVSVATGDASPAESVVKMAVASAHRAS